MTHFSEISDLPGIPSEISSSLKIQNRVHEYNSVISQTGDVTWGRAFQHFVLAHSREQSLAFICLANFPLLISINVVSGPSYLPIQVFVSASRT